MEHFGRRGLGSQRPYSIRTRIKTLAGLVTVIDVLVRDHIPLEQGLRRKQVRLEPNPVGRQRPYSIRTRIKTSLTRLSLYAAVSETIFH